MSSQKLFLYEDGHAEFIGVDMGPMTIHKLEGDHLVIRVAGHKYWSAIGQPWSYAPAQFIVYQIENRVLGTPHVMVNEIVRFPVR